MELKNLNLFKFYYILADLGVPLGGGYGWGWVWVHMEVYSIHACMCMHTHACMQVYGIIGFPQGFPHGCSHLHEIIMFKMHACAYVCVYMHAWETHHTPPPTSTHIQPPHPFLRGAQISNIQ